MTMHMISVMFVLSLFSAMIVCTYSLISSKQIHRHNNHYLPYASLLVTAISSSRVTITGFGKEEDDEFLLTLLNEQNKWDSIFLAATDDETSMKKRFLSRTARYSGLLNVLEFKDIRTTTTTTDGSASIADDAIIDSHISRSNLTSLVTDSSAWIAFNITPANFKQYLDVGIASKVQRIIFASSSSSIDDMNNAIDVCNSAGVAFTGIRHGSIVAGDEDHPYEIVNATTSIADSDVIEKGVLSRVIAELLQINDAKGKHCGVKAGTDFAAAYLNILRSSGLTRTEEVTKMLSGGLQRVEVLTSTAAETEAKKAEEVKKEKELRRIEIERIDAEEATSEVNQSIMKTMEDSDDETRIIQTDEEKINIRTEEILQSVWRELQTRMYVKSTSKSDFFTNNRQMAFDLALREANDRQEKLTLITENESERQIALDNIVDSNRKQYSKLLAFEAKELQNQKDISTVWVKYIYLLLEYTMNVCSKEDILFHNMDQYAQTIMLRNTANQLRSVCNLQPYEVIYDPLDASVIIDRLSSSTGLVMLGQEDCSYIVNSNSDDLLSKLNEKYGNLLKSIAALRGANQIIELAIQTLKAELPAKPPTVSELRQKESALKQQSVSQLRLGKS